MEDAKFWTGLTFLTITVILTAFRIYQSHVQGKRLSMMEVVIRDTQDLRDSLCKPLEGIWSYSLEYERFHEKEEKNWRAAGKAVFIWRSATSTYDVYIGAKVTEEYKPDVLVAFFLEGTLATGRSGWPEHQPTIDAKYLARKGAEEYKDPSRDQLQYTKLDYKRDIDRKHANELTGCFETTKTKGTVRFRRLG